MSVSMSLEFSGLFQPSHFARFKGKAQAKVRQAVASGMQTGGKQVLEKVRTTYARSVKVSRKKFTNVISIKLYDKKPNQMPALLIGTRAPLVAAHAHGATIPGPVLIPLLDDRRIGRKAFGKIIRELVRSGNAEFRRVNGKTLVFAEAGAARQSGININKFRRAERLRRGGTFRKARGKALEVPIAVLVRNVVVRKSFPFTQTVKAGLPDITRAIQAALNKV